MSEPFADGNATLVLFLPDAIESNLVRPIEQWIRDRTGCAPTARHWVSLIGETLDRFYSGLADELPDEWPVISSFFLSGTCVASLWSGANAARVIPAIKGETHPARCNASTIRGSFWCDNPVANLVHVSDNFDDALREIAVLRSLEPDLFAEPLSTQALAQFRDAGPATQRHSGILTLCSLVASMLAAHGVTPPQLDVPDNGDAKETMARAEAWLRQTAKSTPIPIAEAVASYLDGTANPNHLVRVLKDETHVDRWQELMLRCGILSRAGWLDLRVPP